MEFGRWDFMGRAFGLGLIRGGLDTGAGYLEFCLDEGISGTAQAWD